MLQNTYNKKYLSVAAKLIYYKTVIQQKTTYACEKIFKTTNVVSIDRLLKTSNDTKYKEIDLM